MQLRNVITYFYIVMYHTDIVIAGGKIFIKFLTYENPTNCLANGNCCEQGIDDRCSNAETYEASCNKKCRYFFRIKFSQTWGNSIEDYSEIRTNTLSYHDKFEFREKLTPNPIYYSFRTYQGLFRLQILAYDGNKISDNVIDTYQLTIDASAKPNNVFDVNHPYSTKCNGNGSTLHIQYWSTCFQHFYGESCTKYCIDRNDDKGHYTCDVKTGNIKCLDKWIDTSTNCTKRKNRSFIRSSYLQFTENQLHLKQTPNNASLQDPPSKYLQRSIINSGRLNTTALISTLISPVPSIATTSNCTVDTPINITIKLRGSFPMKEKKFYTTFRQDLSKQIKKRCGGLRGIPEAFSVDNITLEDKEYKKTDFAATIIVSTGNRTCGQKIPSCLEKILYDPQYLFSVNRISFVEVCIGNDGCRRQNIAHKKSKYTKKTALLIGGIFAAVVIVVTLVYVIRRCTRRRVILNMTGNSFSNDLTT